jgi:geranylgeranyl reductase family protein
MRNLIFDVLIVGGGPAGASAGLTFLENGISCCIVDKASFPRNKLCGGLLTDKTIKIIQSFSLDIDIDKFYNNTTNKINIYLKDKLMLELESKTPYYLADRLVFDNLLIQSFKAKGGHIIENCHVNKIDLKNSELIIAENSRIKFKFIVGADGTNSYTRKLIDNSYKSDAFCLETDIPKNEFDYENAIGLYFDIMKKGYGWIFPKDNHITIGMGGIINKNINIKKVFNDFLISKNISPDLCNIKGHFVPFGTYIKRPILYNKLVLAGDASGLVDPITGEGIYFSLLSGKYAGEIISDCIKNPDKNNLNNYLNKIRPIQKIIDKGTRLQNIFYNPIFQKLALSHLKNHKDIGNYILDNFISDYNYKDVFDLLLSYFLYKYKKTHSENVS